MKKSEEKPYLKVSVKLLETVRLIDLVQEKSLSISVRILVSMWIALIF